MIQSDTIANIDYSYIVIPVTALSAWLLMLKKTTRTTPAEPETAIDEP